MIDQAVLGQTLASGGRALAIEKPASRRLPVKQVPGLGSEGDWRHGITVLVSFVRRLEKGIPGIAGGAKGFCLGTSSKSSKNGSWRASLSGGQARLGWPTTRFPRTPNACCKRYLGGRAPCNF